MQNLIKTIGFLFLYFSTMYVNAQTQITKVETPGPSGIKFKSAIDSLEYILYIHAPESYTKTGKKYPVIYVTDGQWNFNITKDIYYGQLYDGLVPEIIIVGITWTGDYDANRGKDFTPTPQNGFPNSGNARKFLSIVKNEVIKYMDSNYPVDKSNQALLGSSAGGLFALYTLFQEPDLFNRYIVLSPALWWDNEITFKYENSFAEKKRPLNARIFMSSGEYEEMANPTNTFNRFNNQLKSHHYKGLEIENIVLEKMGHAGGGAMGISRGLQFIYSKPDIKVDISILDKYVGHYQLYEDNIMITRTDNALYANMRGAKIRLYPETNENFYVKGQKGTVEFKKDEKGKVIGYNLIIDNNTMFVKRVD